MGTIVRAFGDLVPVTDPFASAAIDSALWNAAIDVAARAAGSFGAMLVPVRGRTQSMPLSDSMRPAADTYVREGRIHRDERYRFLPAFMRKGVSREFDFMSHEEIARSPYYPDLSRALWAAPVCPRQGRGQRAHMVSFHSAQHRTRAVPARSDKV